MSQKHSCPCCEHRTLDEAPPGTYAICPVCFWEDDPLQFGKPDYEGGANRVSLRQARENYERFNVSELRFKNNVRAPKPHEKRAFPPLQ